MCIQAEEGLLNNYCDFINKALRAAEHLAYFFYYYDTRNKN